MLKYILPIYHGVITFNIYILEGFFNVWLICTTCVYTSCIDTSHWKIICHITKPCFEMIYRYNKSTKEDKVVRDFEIIGTLVVKRER